MAYLFFKKEMRPYPQMVDRGTNKINYKNPLLKFLKGSGNFLQKVSWEKKFFGPTFFTKKVGINVVKRM